MINAGSNHRDKKERAAPTGSALERAPGPIPVALKSLYAAKRTLATAFPEHTFTIDGKIVGDIGEAIAIAAFGLAKLRPGTADHDMKTRADVKVQVKATQKTAASKGVGLGAKKTKFQHLLVFEFDEKGFYEVLYNGPGKYIERMRAHKKSASLSRLQLRACQSLVPKSERLMHRRK